MEEKCQELVGRMMSYAEGGAGFVHRLTKPACLERKFAGASRVRGRCKAHAET